MLHLTHTGPYAGQPLCDAPRARPGDDYQHPAYNPDALERQLLRPDVCPDCLAEFGIGPIRDAECRACDKIVAAHDDLHPVGTGCGCLDALDTLHDLHKAEADWCPRCQSSGNVHDPAKHAAPIAPAHVRPTGHAAVTGIDLLSPCSCDTPTGCPCVCHR